MSFSFLKPKGLKQQYEKAKAAFLPNFSDFEEYERIVAAEPKNYKEGQPDVTDATTASFIETRPRAIVQQTPTGKVSLLTPKSSKDTSKIESKTEIEEILGELIDSVILPNAITGGSVLNKAITAVRKGMTYGSQPALCFVRNDENYFGADFQLLNIRDVFFEPGKTNAKDCNYMFLTAYYTEGDIDSIIASENELQADKDYKTPWEIKKLGELKSKVKEKDEDSKDHNEKKGSEETGVYIKLVHAFQKGKKAKFYTFDPETGDIMRDWENPDPRGLMPIVYFYYDQDTNKPLGNSAIRLTTRLQNMLDVHLQNYQHAVGVKSAPPTKIRGNVDPELIKYEPFAIWDMGDDPNADASIVSTDNTIINTFPQTQGILKSNILNVTNNGDTSVSATVGDPGFSKTPAGIRAQQSRVDVNDNYLRRQFEDFYGDLLTTMLNLHIAAHLDAKEKDIVPLSKRFIDAKRRDDPHYDAETDEIDYSKLDEIFAKFKVDASSSKVDDDREQLEILNNLLELRIKAGEGIESYLKLGPLVRQIIKKSGVQNIDEISPRETEASTEREVASSLANEPLEMEQLSSVNEQLPQLLPVISPGSKSELEEPVQAGQPEDSDSYLAKLLLENGLNAEQAKLVIENLKNGADPKALDEAIKNTRREGR